jgi:hypothetical protein
MCLLLKIVLQNTQTLQLFTNDSSIKKLIEPVASSKSSLLLKIILQNTQTLQLFTNDSKHF